MSKLAINNFTFNAGSSFTMPGNEIDIYGSWTNAGTMTFSNGGYFQLYNTSTAALTNTGTMNTPAGASILGWFVSPQPLVNSGTFEVGGHWDDSAGGQRNVSNSNVVTIDAGGEIDQWEYTQSAGKTLVNGLFCFQGGGQATISGGELAGKGEVEGCTLNVTGGTLIGGDDGSPGTLSFADSTMTMGSDATLESQIQSPSDYGQFAFTGSGNFVTLGGTLDVEALPGASYAGGQVFTILTADSISGTFNTLDLPTGWTVQYNANSVTVTAVPEPSVLGTLLTGTMLLSRRRPRGC